MVIVDKLAISLPVAVPVILLANNEIVSPAVTLTIIVLPQPGRKLVFACSLR